MADSPQILARARLDDEICARIDRSLSGTGLTFALVLWVRGQAENPDSIAISSPPQDQRASVDALRTALAQLERIHGR